MVLYMRNREVFTFYQNSEKVQMCYGNKISGGEKTRCKPLGTSQDTKEIIFKQLINLIICGDVVLSCYVHDLCNDDQLILRFYK